MRLDRHALWDEARLRQEDGGIVHDVVETMYGDAEPSAEVWARIHQAITHPPPPRFSRQWWLQRARGIRFVPALQLSITCGLMLLVLTFQMMHETTFITDEPAVSADPVANQIVSEDEVTMQDTAGFFLSYPGSLAQRKITPYRDASKYATTTNYTGLPIRDPVDEHRRQWFESLRRQQVYNDKLAGYVKLHLPQ